jgi:hypothetical protein
MRGNISVRNYLPFILDGAVDLLMAGGFLFLYYYKKQPKLYNKWWVLLGALSFLVMGGEEIYKGISNYSAQRIPSKSEIENSLSMRGTFAQKEFLYKSPDGYQVLIPAGITYTSSNGAISLIGTRKDQPNTSFSLMIMRQSSSQDLDSLVKDLIQVGMKSSPPKKYIFDEGNNDQGQRRGFVETSNNGILSKAAIVIAKHGKSTYQVMVSTPISNFEPTRAEIERVLNSFKVM